MKKKSMVHGEFCNNNEQKKAKAKAKAKKVSSLGC
jgi:hypothetical protein